MKGIVSRLIVAAALAALAAPALAQNTANLSVNANVRATCQVQTAAPAVTVDWDVYTAGSETASTNVVVRCSKNAVVQVAASAGAGGAAGGFARSVALGADRIGYKLSLTAGGAELSGTAAAAGFTSTGKNVDISIPIHVTLDTAVDPNVGSYSDTVVLTYTAL